MKASILSGAATLAATLALAACGSGSSADSDGDGEISMGEMRAELESADSGTRPDPGKYSTTMSLVNLDLQGAPPEVGQMMGAMMNRTFEFCLTPEMAEEGFEESLKEGQDQSCSAEKFSMDDGEIELVMNCTPEQGGTMRVAMNGTASPTRTEIQIVTSGSVPQMGDLNMEINMVQERIGDCDN